MLEDSRVVLIFCLSCCRFFRLRTHSFFHGINFYAAVQLLRFHIDGFGAWKQASPLSCLVLDLIRRFLAGCMLGASRLMEVDK